MTETNKKSHFRTIFYVFITFYNKRYTIYDKSKHATVKYIQIPKNWYKFYIHSPSNKKVIAILI